MPVFLTLSQANAQRLQDMPGGDEARVNFLTTVLGLQLVGRAGLTPSQQSLVQVSNWRILRYNGHHMHCHGPRIGSIASPRQ